MKKLITFFLAAALLFTGCIIIFKTNDENSSTINVKPDYSTPWKWRPLEAEELFEFLKLYTDEYAELFEKNNLSQDFEIQYACIRENKIYIYTTNNRLLRFEFSDGIWQLQKDFTGGYLKDPGSVNEGMECRLTGDELYELYLKLNNTEKLYDGYQSGNYYILYSSDYVYYVKCKKEECTIVHRGRSDWAETNNIYIDEGLMPNMQYTVNYNCLPNDENKDEAYNAAIDAYNKFIAQKAEETLEWFNEDSQIFSKPPLYAYLKDLNGDNIPELLLPLTPMYPINVFSYRNGEVIELAGPMSNGMHGGCYLLENGMYGSEHSSAGWVNSFVTYNKDGTQTIEIFQTDTIDNYIYSKHTVYSKKEYWNNNEKDVSCIIFEKTEKGEKQFYEMYEPYAEALEHRMDLGEIYSPFNADTSYNYSPYVTEKLQ